MLNNDKSLREIFHFLFLEQLLRKSSKDFYIVKGGVNLRFFFKSPRYSEDMDLDVVGGSVHTLKKNGYKILEDPSFRRSLSVYGIEDVKINDPTKAKQTETTQRFRFRIVNEVGEEFPTKIEFSRRNSKANFVEEEIDPEITRKYKRLSFSCQHYDGIAAVRQKIIALAERSQTQARDVFDLYILFLGGFFHKKALFIDSKILSKAIENELSISYEQYRDQVIAYLDQKDVEEWNSQNKWTHIQQIIFKELS